MALIAHYPLNGDTKDYSGYGNDLTPHGYIPSDDFIGAHKTTTNSDYLVTSKEWVYDQEVTLAIWAKETGNDGSSIAGLISDHYHSPTPMSGITMDIRGNDLAFAVGLGDSRPSYRFPLLFDSSEWCHYAITYNNGLVKLYQNGVMLGSRSVPSIVHVAGRVGGLGRWAPSYGSYHLVGSLSDARVYDHALSEKEIKELAKAKVLHYKFDEQDLATKIVKDCSGFGNDGTVAVATAPTWSEDSPVGRGSMEFDSSVITTGKIFYDDEQEHSVSAWVKPTNIGVGTQNLLNFHMGYTLSRGANGRSLMYMNSGANDHYVYGSKLAENKWTHVTWVYDKSSLRCQVYYDGILHASSTNFDVNDVPSGFKATTILGENFIGNISDVRIYATALTPEDILELYQTRASVDNEGNIFVQEIDEITDTSKEVDSRGIARFKEFNEVGRPVRYIRDWLNGSTSNTSNHWVEIQAIDPSGTNVAKGKSSPSELITDGSTASNPHYSAGSGLKSVTVDLGAAHNITYLHIWHYWSGGRTYHSTKTEVSTDGTNWVTVFDSAIEGEYAESSEGKMIPLYPDKVSIGSDGNIYTNEIMEA